ncbi:uncharacterized protein LOC143042432 isoform X1 [Mytilus galloprovincialis]|uniref:uncharacterized protein LOC143042432 isoform X1 n=1 Tax=Mytilus galloprovincialis TaxID=29158 RepID=UPI003F7C2D4E
MGSSISKKTDKENKKLEKDQQKEQKVTKPAEQPDSTNLRIDPKPSVVVTNKHLHEKKGNLQSLQKEPQQDCIRSITTPNPSVVFTTKNLPQQTSSVKEQLDRTNLRNEPKPSVVVTNKHLHEKKDNLQSLQKEPQQDRTRS